MKRDNTEKKALDKRRQMLMNTNERTVRSELPNLRRNLLRGVQRPVREGDGSHRRAGGDGAGVGGSN